MQLFIGHTQDGQLSLPLNALLRHVVCLGSSGSGKTVACKVLCEELLLSDVPVIAVDPQGDIASMLLSNVAQKQDDTKQPTQDFHKQVEILIWTPGSQAGLPISLDPLKLHTLPKRHTDQIRLISAMATNLAALLGYPLESNDGQSISAYLDLCLQHIVEHKLELQDLAEFAEFLELPPPDLEEQIEKLIVDKKRQEVGRKLAILGVGAKKLLFQMGAPLDIDLLLGKKDSNGRTRCSVIYLNSLHSQEEKEFFVSQLSQSLYNWMLENPSQTPQAALYIDEIAPFIPPVRKPSCKDSLKLLFKQARKYGVICLMATQNPGDVDYTALSQFSTWLLGRLIVRQDLKKVEQRLRSQSPEDVEKWIGELPKLSPGEFFLLSPDVFEKVHTLSIRQLLTEHKTLDLDLIESLLPQEVREQFAKNPLPSNSEETPAKDEASTPREPHPWHDRKKRRRKKRKSNGATNLSTEWAPIPNAICKQSPREIQRQKQPRQPPKTAVGKLKFFMEESPGSYSIKDFSLALNLSESIVRRALKELQAKSLIASEKVSRSYQYWLQDHGFLPSYGITRPILLVQPQKTLSHIRPIVEKARSGKFFGLFRKESIEEVGLRHLLLWQVRFTFNKTTGFFRKVEQEQEVLLYFEASTGTLLSIEDTHLHFVEQTERRVDSFKPLSHYSPLSLEPPAKVQCSQQQWQEIQSPKAIEATCAKLFQGKVIDYQLVAFPYWTFALRSHEQTQRFFYADGLFGNPFDWPQTKE